MTRVKLKKKRAFVVLLAVLVLLPQVLLAQGGMFGRGNASDVTYYGHYRNGTPQFGLLQQTFGSGNGNYYNQGFGDGTSPINNEIFGAPVGGGLLILTAAGACYATLKSRKKKNANNQKKK